MEYLYHAVPKNMAGTILYPLNVLKGTHPDIYLEHAKKYMDREEILSIELPVLNCLWNDVLHLTAITPEELKKNLATAGFVYKPVSAFKIPISLLENDKTIAFSYPRKGNAPSQFREYEAFNPERMEEYRIVPPETIEYYKKIKAENGNPFQYYLSPHILYKGNIDTKDLEIITI